MFLSVGLFVLVGEYNANCANKIHQQYDHCLNCHKFYDQTSPHVTKLYIKGATINCTALCEKCWNRLPTIQRDSFQEEWMDNNKFSH